MLKFLILGAAGYVARKHVEAIFKTNNTVSVIIDGNESIGYIDQYFPKALYFKSIKNFDIFLLKKNISIDYCVICTPNYLHFDHIKFAIKKKYKVICEKPLTINYSNLDKLIKFEKKGLSINTILQLRYNQSLKKLKKNINDKKKYLVDLTYISPRGDWYKKSWKGKINKSGGIIFNLGIHFIDIIIWLFGEIIKIEVDTKTENTISGKFILMNAEVKWFISYDPKNISKKGKFNYYRKMIVNNKIIDLSDNFNNLHIKSYKEILDKKGISVSEVKQSIYIAKKIQNMKLTRKKHKIIRFL